eukprot:5346892-Alexandrium_andersonii.AAC.1
MLDETTGGRASGSPCPQGQGRGGRNDGGLGGLGRDPPRGVALPRRKATAKGPLGRPRFVGH